MIDRFPMTLHSKYFDSIRIRSRAKVKQEPQKQQCQWAGCDKEGSCRAPAGRGREGQYLYFCTEHVREYNKNFNYFSGLDDDAIAKLQKDALTGHRPTWTTSSNGTARTAHEFSRLRSGSAAYQNRMRDPSNLFGAKATPPLRRRKLKTLEARAFATLELAETASGEEIKIQYKALVKRHHPDANGGDRTSEDRLRDVLQAYNLLKQAGFC